MLNNWALPLKDSPASAQDFNEVQPLQRHISTAPSPQKCFSSSLVNVGWANKWYVPAPVQPESRKASWRGSTSFSNTRTKKEPKTEQEQSDCIRLPRFLADPLSLTDRSLSTIDRHGETVTRQTRHSISRTFNGADRHHFCQGLT